MPLLPPDSWIDTALQIDSTTERSNRKIVDFLKPLLEEVGFQIRLQEFQEKGVKFYNLLASSHPGVTGWVYHTHLDTVAPGDLSLWTQGPPFQATRVKGKIYGLGSADVKLDFLLKLWAAKRSKPWVKPFTLVGTYGEERGLVGARKLFEEKDFRPRCALVGEPSELELIIAHKGHLVVEVEIPLVRNSKKRKEVFFSGKAAHSSTPHLGKNAILKALLQAKDKGQAVLELEGGQSSNAVPQKARAVLGDKVPEQKVDAFLKLYQNWQKTLGKVRDQTFSPSQTTLSLNLARTQNQFLTLVFDVRILPSLELEEVKKAITQDLDGLSLRYSILSEDPPLKGSGTTDFVKTCKEILKASGTKPKIRTKASSTEAAIYSEHGIPALVFGAGKSIGNVHRPNEYNIAAQMEAAVRFYELLMQVPER